MRFIFLFTSQFTVLNHHFCALDTTLKQLYSVVPVSTGLAGAGFGSGTTAAQKNDLHCSINFELFIYFGIPWKVSMFRFEKFEKYLLLLSLLLKGVSSTKINYQVIYWCAECFRKLVFKILDWLDWWIDWLDWLDCSKNCLCLTKINYQCYI